MRPLALTMGDPAGVGPEIIALALRDPDLAFSTLVIGDLARLREGARIAKSPVSYRPVAGPGEPGEARGGAVAVLDLGGVPTGLPFGRLSAVGGDAAFRALTRAVDLALAGEVAAVVTAPLNKEALHLAGHPYPGHTEILAERTGTGDWVMALEVSGKLVLHATAHLPLALVPGALGVPRILRVIELADQTLKRMGVGHPRIGVAGLNPHAGEGGLFGHEEARVIAPAIEAARKAGAQVEGPVSPDTVFLRWHRGGFDAVVAMYHDQGHIPVKLLAFESAVQLTLGLPIVRTSVDHGTAFDIAGRGLADPGSLVSALRLASLLAKTP